MRGYSGLEVFKGEECEVLEKATAIVQQLPEKFEGKLLRCHEVSRVVGKLLGLKVRDGRYGPYDHSWCLLPMHTHVRHILDPYCIARLPQVQIIELVVPHSDLYVVSDEVRDDIDAKLVAYLMALVNL